MTRPRTSAQPGSPGGEPLDGSSQDGSGRRSDGVDLEVATRVRDLRRRAQMTQAELADALSVSFQQVQRYETGVNRIGASKLFLIATALDVAVEDLFPASLVEGVKPHAEAMRTAEGRLIDQLLSDMEPVRRKLVLAFTRSLLKRSDTDAVD